MLNKFHLLAVNNRVVSDTHSITNLALDELSAQWDNDNYRPRVK